MSSSRNAAVQVAGYHWLVVVVAAALVTARPAGAQQPGQEGAPSGGGYGCVANGNCEGSLYKDKSNLDKWWYSKCSKCHTVQAPQPADVSTTLTRYQEELVSDARKFWAFHDMTVTDPVLRALTPKSRLIDATRVPSPYKELLTRRPGS